MIIVINKHYLQTIPNNYYSYFNKKIPLQKNIRNQLGGNRIITLLMEIAKKFIKITLHKFKTVMKLLKRKLRQQFGEK